MKKMKKVWALVLALGMVSAAGFTACGDKGGDGNVDEGNDKGEQVTLEQWTAAVTNTCAADNVTVNEFYEYQEHEKWDGETHVYSETGNAVTKLANGVMYGYATVSETEDGVTEEWTEETYVFKEDGTYYEWYRDSYDTLDWMENEYYEAKYNPEFSVTVQWTILGDEWDAAQLIAIYDDLEYDATTGEYSIFIEDEYDPFMMKIKIKNEKFYTLTLRFDSEYERESTDGDDADETGYSEEKYVFVNYGTTKIDSLPKNEEDEGENTTTSSNVKPSTDEGQEVTADGWREAFEATFSATNLLINGNITMEAMGVRETGTEEVAFEGEKLYWEQNTVTGVYKGYFGMGYDESCGYEVPFKWEWNNDASSWDCEYSNVGIVDIEDVFACLACETYMDALYYAYDNAVYNSEKGCYVIDLGPWLSELMSDPTVTGTLEVTIANGLITKIKGATNDEPFEGFTMIEEYEYVITYGNATVGNLPAVTI